MPRIHVQWLQMQWQSGSSTEFQSHKSTSLSKSETGIEKTVSLLEVSYPFGVDQNLQSPLQSSSNGFNESVVM